jgi:hypothetical protein
MYIDISCARVMRGPGGDKNTTTLRGRCELANSECARETQKASRTANDDHVELRLPEVLTFPASHVYPRHPPSLLVFNDDAWRIMCTMQISFAWTTLDFAFTRMIESSIELSTCTSEHNGHGEITSPQMVAPARSRAIKIWAFGR